MKVVSVTVVSSDAKAAAIEGLHKAVALVKANGPVLTEESTSLMASATAALNRLSSELSASAELTAAPVKKIKMTPSTKKAAVKKVKGTNIDPISFSEADPNCPYEA